MKVSVNSLDDMLAELDRDRDHVCNKEIWLRVDQMPASDKNDVDWDVVLCATAVVSRTELPYLLEFLTVTGRVVLSGDDKTEIGIELADAMEIRIAAFCDKHGLTCRCGRMEL